MKTLISLGPTREYIGSVRYISNASSGKMGRSLAKESLRRGNSTSVVSGPVSISLPEDLEKIIEITSTREMLRRILDELKEGYDLFISAAAVSDFYPEKREEKISSDEDLKLNLKKNPKITREVKKKFPSVSVVAFKAEYDIDKEDLLESALKKMERENLDFIVANDIGKNPFGSDSNEVYIVKNPDDYRHISESSKNRVAEEIFRSLEKIK